jgi:uncharacterized membrane protein
MFVLSLVSTRESYAESRTVSLLLLGVAGTGVLFSAWLTYLELFEIHAICQWCVVSAIIVTVIFFVCLADFFEKKETQADLA